MVRVAVDQESIQGTLGIRQKYTLNGMPVYHRKRKRFLLLLLSLLLLISELSTHFEYDDEIIQGCRQSNAEVLVITVLKL